MTIEELSSRLSTVERANRRMKAAGAAVVVLLLGAAAMGQSAAPPKVVRAQTFEVVGSDGKTRAPLGLPVPVGGTVVSGVGGDLIALLYYDEKGVPRVMLDLAPDGAGLSFSGKDGIPRTVFNMDTAGIGSFVLADGMGKGRARLAIEEDGTPSLSLYDPAGKKRLTQWMAGTGAPRLLFRDAEGVNAMTLAVEEDGTTGVSLWDRKSGKPRVAVAVDAGGVQGVSQFDAEGRPRAALSLLPDGSPEFTLLDRAGKTLFQEPKAQVK